jgi:hypothetical protein
MIRPGRQLLTLFITLLLSVSAVADSWFDNDDSLTDLARLAPSDAALFVALDLSRTVSPEDLAGMLRELVEKVGGTDAVVKMEREIGNIDELSRVFGTRMVLSLRPPKDGKSEILFAWEAKQPDQAVQALKATGLIPARAADKTIEVGDSTFEFIKNGGFGIYQDYLIISNSPELLKSALVDKESLRDKVGFHNGVGLVDVEQGILIYGKVPEDFVGALPGLDTLGHLLAGIDVSREQFLTAIIAVLNKDGSLTRALLSKPGTLNGQAARYIPEDWGLMVSFHLGYVHRFIESLEEDAPTLAGPLVYAKKDIESEFGVSLEEFLEMVDGEVSFSSNGLRTAPLYYMGYDTDTDYKLTLTMPVKEPLAVQSLLRESWIRWGLQTEKLLDDIVVAPDVEMCFVVHKKQLIVSFGPKSLETLRECLALREGESLMSRPGVAQHYPIHNAAASAYVDLRPTVKELRTDGRFGTIGSLLLLLDNDAVLEGTTNLTVHSDGLRLIGTGGMPLFAGAGAGGYLIFGASSFRDAPAEVRRGK